MNKNMLKINALDVISFSSIPIFLPLLTLVNHLRGPSPTLRLTNRSATFLQMHLHPWHTPQPMPKIAAAERLIWRLSHYTPKAACLERACALKIFLSCYGIPASVVIGQRLRAHTLLLHAWLETSEGAFFYDENFAENWRSDNDVEPSMPSSKAGI